MQIINSIISALQSMGGYYGAAMMRSIIGIMGLVPTSKINPLHLPGWLNTSSRHFPNWKGFASRTPGVVPLTPVRASVHFGEPHIMERLPMLWDTLALGLALHALVRASCSIF